MKSFTIHGIDEETEKLLKKRAISEGRSVNKVVKELMGKALGLGAQKRDNRDEFLDLLGVWTEEDEKSFLMAIEDLENADREDWR